MTDQHARLKQLLARHDDVVLCAAPNGTVALYRRHQLLVAARHADRACEAIGRYVARREDLLDVGVTRLRLRPDSDVDARELVAKLRVDGDFFPMAVSLNHLVLGGLVGVPTPSVPMSAPFIVDTSARRVFVGVVDTGIVSHPWFADSDWFAGVTSDELDPIPADVDYALKTQSGHGTLVAGVLVHQAPTAFLMVERALGEDGVGDELDLLRALARLRMRMAATGESLDVLNLSLGGYRVDDEPSPLIAEALGRFGKQTIIVAAAGDSGSNRPFWPAALKNCVAVGALEQDGMRRAEFSNHGWWVDACAIGTEVGGPFLNDGHRFFGYALWSSTTVAAPRVAGAIAGFAASKHLSAIEAAETLLDPATRQSHPDFGVVFEGIAGGAPIPVLVPDRNPSEIDRRSDQQQTKPTSRQIELHGPPVRLTPKKAQLRNDIEDGQQHIGATPKYDQLGRPPDDGESIEVSLFLKSASDGNRAINAVRAFLGAIGAETLDDEQPVVGP